jgi:Tfp pilus assembly protein PilF
MARCALITASHAVTAASKGHDMPTELELYNEAEKLMEEGKDEEAVAKLNELVAQDESYTLAHLALAKLYGKVGKPEEAVRHGERACELEPDDSINFTFLSETYRSAFQATQDPKYIHLAEESMAKAHMKQMGG